jgi:hypothetical protein
MANPNMFDKILPESLPSFLWAMSLPIYRSYTAIVPQPEILLLESVMKEPSNVARIPRFLVLPFLKLVKFFLRPMSADRSENTATEDFGDNQSREAFKITAPNPQPDYDWSRQPIPPELRLNQEDDSLHPTLRQILAWSLNVSCQPSDSGPGGGNTDGEDTASSSKGPSNPASERRFDSQGLLPPATASKQVKSEGGFRKAR